MPECNRSIPGEFLMCPQHWALVPQALRSRVVVCHEEGLALAYKIARWLAVREVAIAEGKLAPSEEKFQALLAAWRQARDELRAELGEERYQLHVSAFRRRLRKLMEQCGGGCPIEVAERVLQYDTHGGLHDRCRRAAAVDLFEGRELTQPHRGADGG